MYHKFCTKEYILLKLRRCAGDFMFYEYGSVEAVYKRGEISKDEILDTFWEATGLKNNPVDVSVEDFIKSKLILDYSEFQEVEKFDEAELIKLRLLVNAQLGELRNEKTST